jgi:hypothetical protein
MSGISGSHSKIIWITAIGCLLLFLLLQNSSEGFGGDSGSNLPTNKKIDLKNICSVDCCSTSNWPAPHDTMVDSRVQDNPNLIGTNLMCDGNTGSGCVCATKKQFAYLAKRGGNANGCN